MRLFKINTIDMIDNRLTLEIGNWKTHIPKSDFGYITWLRLVNFFGGEFISLICQALNNVNNANDHNVWLQPRIVPEGCGSSSIACVPQNLVDLKWHITKSYMQALNLTVNMKSDFMKFRLKRQIESVDVLLYTWLAPSHHGMCGVQPIYAKLWAWGLKGLVGKKKGFIKGFTFAKKFLVAVSLSDCVLRKEGFQNPYTKIREDWNWWTALHLRRLCYDPLKVIRNPPYCTMLLSAVNLQHKQNHPV